MPPNILLLFTDMQRADTIHALGNPIIRTPALDRLVHEGTAFTNCQTPSPVCVPARCCLQYGQYPTRTGLANNGTMMADNGQSYPALLAAHGYRTQAIGKCHFTPDHRAARGFQARLLQEECTSDPAADDYVAWLAAQGHDYYEPHGARGEMYYIPQVSTLPAAAHPTQWIGDRSLEFLAEAGRRDQPWCLFASFIHPHPPFAPPKPWHRLYRTSDMPLPVAPPHSAELHTWVNRHQNRYKYRDRGLDLNLLRTIKAYYYATISFVDYQIGRLLTALAESGQLDRTLVVFSSDHGEHLGDLNCFGKRSMHDASARVPLLARLPGRFPAGHHCAAPTSLVDLLPTFLGAAGVPATGLALDGLDLAAVARGDTRRDWVFSQFGHRGKAIYMAAAEQWKYVYSAGDRREWFFDRVADPLEHTDAPGDPRLPAARLALQRFLHQAGSADAVTGSGTDLAWREWPPADEAYLADPDAQLLRQDYPSYPLALPGYSD